MTSNIHCMFWKSCAKKTKQLVNSAIIRRCGNGNERRLTSRTAQYVCLSTGTEKKQLSHHQAVSAYKAITECDKVGSLQLQ
jgi:hypothetical protein